MINALFTKEKIFLKHSYQEEIISVVVVVAVSRVGYRSVLI